MSLINPYPLLDIGDGYMCGFSTRFNRDSDLNESFPFYVVISSQRIASSHKKALKMLSGICDISRFLVRLIAFGFSFGRSKPSAREYIRELRI